MLHEDSQIERERERERGVRTLQLAAVYIMISERGCTSTNSLATSEILGLYQYAANLDQLSSPGRLGDPSGRGHVMWR